MNDNQPPPFSEPNFDPHRDGKRGFLIGACGMSFVIALLFWLFG
jgi:hypothetical protein